MNTNYTSEDVNVAQRDAAAGEIAERMKLALDGWNYQNANDYYDPHEAEFMADSAVCPTASDGEAEFLMVTGEGRRFRVTVKLDN
jgi:hypothetical protein